jgi:epoxyqueuosine reductase
LARWLLATSPCEVKVFVDTAAVMEKPLGQAAALGWQGKHTNLVSREFGSWLFLGAIFTTLELPRDAAELDHCGACRACLDICPTAAFPSPYKLDARRCISYLTIEHHSAIPVELRAAIGNRIFGCDDCQLVCPWNKFARAAAHPDFKVRHRLDGTALTELFRWTTEEFEERTRGSAIHRLGYERWSRNIAVALGNAPSSTEVIRALEERRGDTSPLVREHVEWAIERQRSSGGQRPAEA